jgi:hypothetical protein
VSTVLNALHVVLAVLVIGPLVMAPFLARRAIIRRDADGVRFAANQVALFGAGAVVVAGLGVGTVLTGDEWTLTTPWVVVASTLFVVAIGLTWGYAVPAVRRAASMVAAGVPDGRAATQVEAAQVAATQVEATQVAAAQVETAQVETQAAQADPPPATDGRALTEEELAEADTVPTPLEQPAGAFVTTADLLSMQRLDNLSARITGTGWLLLVTFSAIVALMTIRPFA